jgi:hypothetical protein
MTKLKRGFSDPAFAAGGESEYDREFRAAIMRLCPMRPTHGGCLYPDCPQKCQGRQLAATELEAR